MWTKIAEILIGTVCVCGFLFIVWVVFDFLYEIPKQLKRIADALEKDGDNDG